MRRIDLNVDVGEGFPHDRDLLNMATSANVCCGIHAGSPEATRATVLQAREHGVVVGAHPGFPDRRVMGREPWAVARMTEAEDSLLAQLALVSEDARYLKPHGAFYNQSASQEAWAGALARLLRTAGLPLYGLPGTLHVQAAREAGVRFVAEGFAERAYRPDGHLVPRGEPGAEIATPEAAAVQALALAERVETICIHGDRLGAVEILHGVRTALVLDGFEVRACV
ncbi:MAG: LamB/YcsF family protein [Fimbriimonadaceae bacterium]|nr:LamB/YcsF family protein [Fimbriimonadaceae bacterium]